MYCHYFFFLIRIIQDQQFLPKVKSNRKTYIVSVHLYGTKPSSVEKRRIMIIGLGLTHIRQIFKKRSFISWRSLVVSYRALFLDLFDGTFLLTTGRRSIFLKFLHKIKP